MYTMDGGFALKVFDKDEIEIGKVAFNVSLQPSSGVVTASDFAEQNYEQFFANVWLTILLTLIVVCCVCLMCFCSCYHMFQQRRSAVIEARNAATLESAIVESELPSYTIASGLPTYEEALERLKEIKDLSSYSAKTIETDEWTPHTPPTPAMTLSVINLFPSYKNNESVTSVKTT